MIIVKITALLFVLFIIWLCLVRMYLKADMQESLKVKFTEYCPWYVSIVGILFFSSVIGIIASVVYLLFFR